jgi:curli biogenesis system outer membrane secretion channel CsgG
MKEASIVPVSGASSRPSVPAVVLISLLLLLSSCGYHFTPVGGVVPESAKSIAILTFLNNTNEPYVDIEVTKAVTDEFLTDGRLRVVSLEGADLILKGSVVKYEVIPQSYTAQSYVQQYLVGIGVNVSVEEVKTHKVIWQENGLGTVFVASFPVAIGDITSTKIAKEAAIKRASQDVASTLRSRLLEGF